jgi:DUF4097 and DUF4098 domain-containing protein YvlB
MPTSTFLVRSLAVLMVVAPAAAMGQRSDAEWLEDCRDNRNHDREKFCEVREVRTRASGGAVSMEGLRNGGVFATGWDRDSIVVKTRIEAQAGSESRARDIARQVRTVISGSTITVEGPRYNDDESWSASLVTMVPRRSDLRIETRNGPVTVESVKGTMNLETRNGPLGLRELGGDVRARTTNGPLSISLSGSTWDGSGLDAQTTNGPLTISVPEGYNARLETGTRNGPVNIGFPITVVGRITQDISTDLGKGGPTIRAKTTNGPLNVRRK